MDFTTRRSTQRRRRRRHHHGRGRRSTRSPPTRPWASTPTRASSSASFVFEDVGVTAYGGAAAYIKQPDLPVQAAAGILAVEAYHASEVRLQLLQLGQAAPGHHRGREQDLMPCGTPPPPPPTASLRPTRGSRPRPGRPTSSRPTALDRLRPVVRLGPEHRLPELDRHPEQRRVLPRRPERPHHQPRRAGQDPEVNFDPWNRLRIKSPRRRRGLFRAPRHLTRVTSRPDD